MESWPSGLRQQVANLSIQETGSVGSNPTLSTIRFRSSKLGVGGGLLIHEAGFESLDRSQTIVGCLSGQKELSAKQ